MLGTCPSLLSSKSSSSVRHKVRKLRAKVRSLIPEQGCENYKKRNDKIDMFLKRRPRECFVKTQSCFNKCE